MFNEPGGSSGWVVSLFCIFATLISTCGAIVKRSFDSDELLHLPSFSDAFHDGNPAQPLSRRAIHSVLTHPTWKTVDPEFSSADQHQNSVLFYPPQVIGDHHHVRVLPRFGGIPVFGADRVLTLSRRTGRVTSLEISGRDVQTVPTLRWEDLEANGEALSVEAALKTARGGASVLALKSSMTAGLGLSGQSSSTADNMADNPEFTADRVYYAETSVLKEVRPAWMVTDYREQLLDRQVRFVDAVTGRILSSIPTVWHAKAMVYPMEPGVKLTPKVTALKEVDLPDVVSTPSPMNGGAGLYGKHFRTMNTCYFYRCHSSPGNATCNENDVVCVDASEIVARNGTSNPMMANRDYFTVPYYFTMDGRFIDLDRDWNNDGYANSTIYMLWDRAALLAPRIKLPIDGTQTYAADVDGSTYTGAETNDTLSEAQAYYHASLQMQLFKDLLGDPDFCMVGVGANCTGYDAIRNRNATSLDSPMKILTNLQTVSLSPSTTSPYADLFTQLQRGRGKTIFSPIMFRDAAEYSDAFFSNVNRVPPGMDLVQNGTSSYWNDTRDCRYGQCLSIYDTNYDFFAFGQGAYDWSLNACTVFHEVTHALVGKFIPTLPSFMWTSNGLRTDPGAMNEAWADYFASIHCGFADFRKTYNGRPYRSIDNNMTCQDTVGEVHTDGTLFSGAFWSIRTKLAVKDPSYPTLFDKVVLNALMQGQSTDTIPIQFNRVLSILKTDPVLSQTDAAAIAQEEFDRRELQCDHVTVYDETMDTTYQLTSARATVANLTTQPNQMVFYPRKSDWGFRVDWRQFYSSPVLGSTDVGYARTRLMALIAYDCRIQFRENKATGGEKTGDLVSGYAVCDDGTETELIWESAEYSNDTKRGGLSLKWSTPRNFTRVAVWFAHQVPATMVMSSTALVYYGWHRYWMFAQAGVGTLMAVGWIVFAVVWFVSTVVAFGKDRRKMGGDKEEIAEEKEVEEKVGEAAPVNNTPNEQTVVETTMVVDSVSSATAATVKGSSGTDPFSSDQQPSFEPTPQDMGTVESAPPQAQVADVTVTIEEAGVVSEAPETTTALIPTSEDKSNQVVKSKYLVLTHFDDTTLRVPPLTRAALHFPQSTSETTTHLIAERTLSLLRRRRRLMILHSFISAFIFGCAGASALVALFYGPFRIIGLFASLCGCAAVALIDIIVGLSWTFGWVPGTREGEGGDTAPTASGLGTDAEEDTKSTLKRPTGSPAPMIPHTAPSVGASPTRKWAAYWTFVSGLYGLSCVGAILVCHVLGATGPGSIFLSPVPGVSPIAHGVVMGWNLFMVLGRFVVLVIASTKVWRLLAFGTL
ncbi:hypothetical protein BJ742DRAFT_795884 [Cladochytrium replicatum]|nr:hypothetical protein BJ742DRAFT_795884 [Cladochytrium replicatum]